MTDLVTFVARAAPRAAGPEVGDPPVAWPVAEPVLASARDGREFGVLAGLVSADGTTDVFVNPDGSVWCDRGGGVIREPGIRIPPDEARDLAVRLIALGGRHVDEATPCVDVRPGAGARVHVALEPISTGGPAISIRLQRLAPLTIDELVADSFFSDVAVEQVLALVDRRANLLIIASCARRSACVPIAW